MQVSHRNFNHSAYAQSTPGALVRNLKSAKRIVISTIDALHILKIDQILYCSADSNYCQIYCDDGRRITVSKTLKRIEAALPSEKFIRVHQSHIVSIDRISLIRKDWLITYGGVKIPVSRGRRSALLTKIEIYDLI